MIESSGPALALNDFFLQITIFENEMEEFFQLKFSLNDNRDIVQSACQVKLKSIRS